MKPELWHFLTSEYFALQNYCRLCKTHKMFIYSRNPTEKNENVSERRDREE